MHTPFVKYQTRVAWFGKSDVEWGLPQYHLGTKVSA